MKIGILTFHRAHNYGAMLQAYALQTVLESMGNRVSFVDYEIPEMLSGYKWFYGIRSIVNRNFFTKGIKNLIKLPLYKNRYDKFESFKKKYIHDTHDGLSKLDLNYDCIVIGSDQVFNPKTTKGLDNAYWGKLPYNGRIITYAASGNYNTTMIDKHTVQTLLERFSAISVRESYIKTFFETLTDLEIHLSLDPTLLLKKDDWEKMVKQPKISKKYILYYYVRHNDRALEFAKSFALSKGLPLIVIGSFNSQYSSKCAFVTGPLEFLGWIKNAEYVIGSSFHCTIFSIVFNKPFCVLKLGDGGDGRALTLLTSLGLENHMVSPDSTAPDNVIAWNRVNKKINDMRKPSIDYLKHNISDLI